MKIIQDVYVLNYFFDSPYLATHITKEVMCTNDLPHKLGGRIIQLRNNAGLRQVDLAFKADIDDAFLRRIETGKVNPTIRTLEKIAKGLEVEMRDLFDFK